MTCRSENPPELLAFENTQLARIERENRRAKQDTSNTGEARSIDMENEQPEYVDADAAPDPPRPINNINRAMCTQEGEEPFSGARTTFGNLNISREDNSTRREEIFIGLAKCITKHPYDPSRAKQFRKMMSLIPRGTALLDAWEHYSLRGAFEGSSLTKEQAKKVYEVIKPATRPTYVPYNKDSNWPLTPLKWIEKKNDPGKFSVSCIILGREFQDCLCDTESCIRLIPKVAADRIGITIYKESNISLIMADTTAIPILRKIHKVPVRVRDHLVRTDFHVIDTRGDQSASIVFGRPFLAIVGAVTDLPRKRVTCTHIGPHCVYPAIPTEFSLHESTLDKNSKRRPKSNRKGDYKGKKAATKANEGIVVKGPDVKARGEASRSCSSNLETIPLEYCTNETTVADVNKFGDTGDPKLTHPELKFSGVSTTSDGRSITAASLPHQS